MLVSVTFCLQRRNTVGIPHKLEARGSRLGNDWTETISVPLTPCKGDLYVGSTNIYYDKQSDSAQIASPEFFFKYVELSLTSSATWEHGENRVIRLDGGSSFVFVSSSWREESPFSQLPWGEHLISHSLATTLFLRPRDQPLVSKTFLPSRVPSLLLNFSVTLPRVDSNSDVCRAFFGAFVQTVAIGFRFWKSPCTWRL